MSVDEPLTARQRGILSAEGQRQRDTRRKGERLPSAISHGRATREEVRGHRVVKTGMRSRAAALDWERGRVAEHAIRYRKPPNKRPNFHNLSKEFVYRIKSRMGLPQGGRVRRKTRIG